MTNSGYNTFKQGVPADTVAEMKPEVFAALQKLPGNGFCVDCGAKSPDWGSPALGILFCLKCSGVHRYVAYTICHEYCHDNNRCLFVLGDD